MADADRLAHWGSSAELLEGVWISGVGKPPPRDDVDAWARDVAADLCNAWTAEGSVHGPAFVIDEEEPFVGTLYLGERPSNALELAYGVAPPFRRRGIASRAARLAAAWALTDAGYSSVELRIAASHPEREEVARRASFTFVERFVTHIEGTGRDAVDLLYVRNGT